MPEKDSTDKEQEKRNSSTEPTEGLIPDKTSAEQRSGQKQGCCNRICKYWPKLRWPFRDWGHAKTVAEFVFAAAIAVATGFNVFVALWQWQTSREAVGIAKGANEIANEALVAVQRAFITVDELKLTPYLNNGKTVSWFAEPIIQNKGATTATDVRIKAIITFVTREQLNLKIYKSIFIPFDPSEITDPVSSVLESQSGIRGRDSKWDGKRITQTLAIDNVEIWSDFVWGVVRYKDVFFPNTKEHFTEYCFLAARRGLSNAEKPPDVERCEGHNCTDEQCEREKIAPRERVFNYDIRGQLPSMERFDEGPRMRDLVPPGTQLLLPRGGWPANPLEPSPPK